MSSSECAPPSVPSKTKSIDGGSTLHINLRVAANCGVLHQGPALVCQKSLFSDISVCLCRVWGVWVLSTAILPCWPHLPLMRFWKPIKGHHCLLFWLRQKWAVRSIRQTLSSWPGNTTISPRRAAGGSWLGGAAHYFVPKCCDQEPGLCSASNTRWRWFVGDGARWSLVLLFVSLIPLHLHIPSPVQG